MATLTNPINAQNIINRFADYVPASANTGIVWGTNANPSYTDGGTVEIVADASFGGTTAGRSIGVTGTSITPNDNIIDGPTIYNALVAETNAYTRIKKLRAVLTVTGSGGNRPAGPLTGNTGGTNVVVYDETNIAHMAPSFVSNITIDPASTFGLANGQVISSANLQNFFDTLKTKYVEKRNTVSRIDKSACHSSCHSSCHGSRSRR